MHTFRTLFILLALTASEGCSENRASVFREHPATVRDVAFSSDGKLVSASDGSLAVTDIAQKETIFKGTGAPIAIRPHSTELAAARFFDDGIRQGIGILNWKDGKEIRYWGADFPLNDLAFSPDGRELVAAGNSSLQVWDAKEGRLLATLDKKECESVAYSPDGKWIASAAPDSIRIWNAANKKQVTLLKAPPGFSYSLLFSPDGKTLALLVGVSSIGCDITLWRTGTWKQFASIEIHGALGMAFSSDSKWLATAGVDRTAKIFSVEPLKEVATYHGRRYALQSVAFSPDDKLLVAGTGEAKTRGKVLSWDVTAITKKSTPLKEERKN